MKRKTALRVLSPIAMVLLAICGRPAQGATPPSSIIITPRSWEVIVAFQELERKGLRLFYLGNLVPSRWELRMPAELRSKPIDGVKFVETVAAHHALKVSWVHNGKWAVLSNGTSDAEMERARKDLASTDASVRRDAARRCDWLRDARTVPLLIDAAKDPDSEVRRLALATLRRESAWDAALALDERVRELLSAELESNDIALRSSAARALWNVGGEQNLALLEKLSADPDRFLKYCSAFVLGRPGGEKLLTLGKELGDDNEHSSSPGSQTLIDFRTELGGISRDRVLPLLQKALAGQDFVARENAVRMLGMIGVEQDLSLLEQTLAAKNDAMHAYGCNAAAKIGGEKALPLFEKMLLDPATRSNAVSALMTIGSEKALALLEKDVSNKDDPARWKDFETLGFIGGDKALARLERAMAELPTDLEEWRRSDQGYWIFNALTEMGGEQVVPVLEKALGNKLTRLPAIYALKHARGKHALDLLDQVLSNGSPNECMAACEALQVMDTDAANLLLEKALANPDAGVRGRAALILGSGSRGTEQSAKYLEMVLENSAPGVRQGAAWAMRRLKVELALPLLEKAMTNPDAFVINNSAWCLARIGGEKALALLEARLHDPVARVRFSIASQLGQGSAAGDPQPVALLEKFLADPDPTVRADAARALMQIGGAASHATFEKLLTDPDVRLRTTAATALAQGGGAKAAEKLKALLADPDVGVRNIASTAQLRLGGPAAAALLAQLLKDPNPIVRANAISSISGDGNTALEQLEIALNDDAPQVRIAAVNVLKALDNEEALELLTELVKDTNAVVRQNAFYALVNSGNVAACDSLGSVVLSEKNETLRNLMVAAVNERFPEVPAIQVALRKIMELPPLPKAAKPPIEPTDTQF